eukprot:CAMPEP_0167797146 /NCGR_PEP_ID=MMETSP0111_2-20121227/15470_1 /TAXON_ID=91324 /ORGANISM="Lotharella globosa, Strain CCCM811" /LENGTH=243 /DNA_ID=CAMNT_0007691175 /DNA_START=46 /DNA_END=775 /DNA_ORIENTATION=-
MAKEFPEASLSAPTALAEFSIRHNPCPILSAIRPEQSRAEMRQVFGERKPGSSPVAGGVLNPAYWRLEVIKAEMFKQIPLQLKVLLLGAGTGRDAFYFEPSHQVTLEGLTVGLQNVIEGGMGALPRLQMTQSIKKLPDASFDVVVTCGEFSRVTENGKRNADQWLQGVQRVLKPNGRILFIEPVEAEFPRRVERMFDSSVNSDAEALLGPFVKFDYGEAVLFDERDSAAGDGTGGFGKKASKS